MYEIFQAKLNDVHNTNPLIRILDFYFSVPTNLVIYFSAPTSLPSQEITKHYFIFLAVSYIPYPILYI